MTLELIEKDQNNCIISGFVTRNYINNIIALGDQFIVQADSPKFDFSGSKACDSTSVALAVHWWRVAQGCNKQISFINLPKEMLAIMKLSNINHIIN